MKVILQEFEPRQLPLAPVAAVAKPMVRKPRLHLNPIVSDARLFHAL